MNWFFIAEIFFSCLLAYEIVSTVYHERNDLAFIWKIWKQFRVMMLFETLGVLALLLTAAYYLLKIPWLKYGWYNLLFQGNGNSIVMAPVTEAIKSNSVSIQIVAIVVLVVMIFVLPFWAKREEVVFREGIYKWKDVSKKSIRFGLMHLLMGIPVAFGIALIIPGFFFAYKYRITFVRQLEKELGLRNHDVESLIKKARERDAGIIEKAETEATIVSTRYHTMYNTVAISFLLFVAVLSILY